MFLSSKMLLVCVVLFQSGPGGGGQGGPGGGPPLQACTCLMVDGTQSCQSLFGARPDPSASLSCSDQICSATTNAQGALDPTCPLPVGNKVTKSEPVEVWQTEMLKYKPPGPGQQGMDRYPTTQWPCNTEYFCFDCYERTNISPRGMYCATSITPIDWIPLYGLCTNSQVCNGEGGVQ